jgi:hypothetical protein
MKKVNATYVSVWDGGNEIRTKCRFDLETKNATDVESADVSNMELEMLDEQFVELEDGTKITEFTVDGEEI